MIVLVVPTRGLVPAMDGSLRYPTAELAAVAGLSSFLRMLRPPEPAVLAVPDFVPLSGLLTLCGLAAVPCVLPCVLVGSSGFRMARGPVALDDPPTGWRLIRASRSRPPDLLSFRRRTLLPSRGWTEIFVPAGLRLRFWLVRLIRVKPLSESPLRALAEMWGSLS